MVAAWLYEKTSSVFAWPDLKTRGLGEFSPIMQTLDCVSGLDNFWEFSQSFECLDQVMETEKVSQ